MDTTTKKNCEAVHLKKEWMDMCPFRKLSFFFFFKLKYLIHVVASLRRVTLYFLRLQALGHGRYGCVNLDLNALVVTERSFITSYFSLHPSQGLLPLYLSPQRPP